MGETQFSCSRMTRTELSQKTELSQNKSCHVKMSRKHLVVKTNVTTKVVTRNGVVTKRPLGTLCGRPQAPRRRLWPSRPGRHPILSGSIADLFGVVLKSGGVYCRSSGKPASKLARNHSEHSKRAQQASKIKHSRHKAGGHWQASGQNMFI